MWEKMSPEVLNESLDNGVRNYRSSKRRYFLNLTVIAVLFAITLTFGTYSSSFLQAVLAFANIFYAVILFFLLFIPVEVLLTVIWYRDFRRFDRMDLEAKRDFIYSERKKKAGSVCVACQRIYDGNASTCPECGNQLESSANYSWIEPPEAISQTSETTVRSLGDRP